MHGSNLQKTTFKNQKEKPEFSYFYKLRKPFNKNLGKYHGNYEVVLAKYKTNCENLLIIDAKTILQSTMKSCGTWFRNKKLVSWPGFEPGTTALKGRCSTD